MTQVAEGTNAITEKSNYIFADGKFTIVVLLDLEEFPIVVHKK